MTWLWRHWRHSQQRQQVNNVIAFWNLHAKLCFVRVLKRSLSAHLMRVKLLLFTFYLNGGLHAVSIGKPSEWMSNFWTVRFLSRVSILTRDIDIANLSVCLSVYLSVRNVPVSDENGLTYRHSFFSPYGRPIILVLPASNIFTKFRRDHPLRGR